ncbi:uncharacterized protein LOC124177152 [Neodiprion fabricii]|uniref:uncharacterized protein LOC124177152 n=1 Tax=Neodiprion fabricii TaxID=2872261 RepID=UPI001ED8EA91|nr:uncharacterized protein LOC124177152 [Neodiprion fabricii]
MFFHQTIRELHFVPNGKHLRKRTRDSISNECGGSIQLTSEKKTGVPELILSECDTMPSKLESFMNASGTVKTSAALLSMSKAIHIYKDVDKRSILFHALLAKIYDTYCRLWYRLKEE